jgi:hypothetical protein
MQHGFCYQLLTVLIVDSWYTCLSPSNKTTNACGPCTQDGMQAVAMHCLTPKAKLHFLVLSYLLEGQQQRNEEGLVSNLTEEDQQQP